MFFTAERRVVSFARRIVRIGRPVERKIDLDDVERSGNPNAIAANVVELQTEVEKMRIGGPRASSLYGACIRMHVLGTIYKREKKQWESFKDRVTFGIGNAIHFWMQNTPDVFGSRRRGWWKCSACGRVRYFGGPPRRPCEHCGAKKTATFYHEHYMKVREPLIVTGHPDMFWEKTNKVFRVCELKSISGEMFPSLAAPLIAHVWQVQTYMWGSEFDKSLPIDVDRNVGYILYVSKKEHTDQIPVKMFPVKRDEALVLRIRAKLGAYVRGMKEYPKWLPPMDSHCETSKLSSYRARFCPVREECGRAWRKESTTAKRKTGRSSEK